MFPRVKAMEKGSANSLLTGEGFSFGADTSGSGSGGFGMGTTTGVGPWISISPIVRLFEGELSKNIGMTESVASASSVTVTGIEKPGCRTNDWGEMVRTVASDALTVTEREEDSSHTSMEQ
jgi:hypothetical protein